MSPTDNCSSGWSLRRRGSDFGHGVGPPRWHKGIKDCISVQPDRSCRVRYGRVRDIAPYYSWGFFNRITDPDRLSNDAMTLAVEISQGPGFAHGLTKKMLAVEWAMALDAAIDAESVAQALCMQTGDFRRAYHAFANRQKPVFEGN
jgi:hypothetical protein